MPDQAFMFDKVLVFRLKCSCNLNSNRRNTLSCVQAIVGIFLIDISNRNKALEAGNTWNIEPIKHSSPRTRMIPGLLKYAN